MNPEGIQEERAQQPSVAEPRPILQPPLTEDELLAQLERRNLPPETIEELSQNSAAMKSRKACVALAAHPRAPRHLALRLIRQFYTFDLMRFTLQPSVAADLRHVAEEQLIARLTSVTLGERLALARRGSQAVAAALLLDKESPVSRTALENPRLTEAAVVKALMRPNSPAAFVELVCHHSKWSVRREIRMALLRSQHTPLARALEFASTLPPPLLRDILHTSRLPEKIKVYLRNNLKERK
ncbi:MAG: hypothetical protein WBW38_22820 [Candidatus Sulfotelmatobacter sp.]